MAAVLALIAAGCASQRVVAGSDVEPFPSTAGTRPPLEAVLESRNAVIDDLPAEWTQQDQWFIEGGETMWDTGCTSFDRLADVYLSDTPTITVWTSAGAEITQRVASLNWDAPAYLASVQSLPKVCPTLEIDGATIEVRSLTDDGVINYVPSSDWAVIELSAYPVPDQATELDTPSFALDRPTYLVVLVRHNVVSQLFIATEGELGRELVEGVVIAADQALQGSPVEGTGPFTAPTPPPTAPPQTLDAVELTVDRTQCRNDGRFTVDGIGFALAEGVPLEWRDIDPLIGDVVINGATATFTGPDGQSVTLDSGSVNADCPTWETSPPKPPSETWGRLDCTGRGLTEVRTPDEGQTPKSLATAAQPEVVTVEAGHPLQWWGLDGSGTVVVAVLLGDAIPANYQIITCTEG
ncbi:MAG: hypothetical protein GY939_09030 [Actinomycetia bacterium]|nr:hypothetical protein [Actinomycetes bacterium]